MTTNYPIPIYNWYLYYFFMEEQWYKSKISQFINDNSWIFNDEEESVDEFFDCKSNIDE